MTLLSEFLSKIKSSELDEQVKQLSDKIFEEEKDKIEHIEDLPRGPNIFLCLEAPGRGQGEVVFVALEREAKEKYIVSIWAMGPPSSIGRVPRRVRAFEVKEVKAEKILLEFAQTFKNMKGV